MLVNLGIEIEFSIPLDAIFEKFMQLSSIFCDLFNLGSSKTLTITHSVRLKGFLADDEFPIFLTLLKSPKGNGGLLVAVENCRFPRYLLELLNSAFFVVADTQSQQRSGTIC